MATTAYSTVLLAGARLPAVGAASPLSVLLPRRNLSPLRLQDAPRLSLLRVKASSDDTSSSAATGDELIEDLKAKWDAVEDKTTVLTYAGGAIVALWISSVIVGAVNSVPLCNNLTCMSMLQLPKLMEFVGLGYTGWFVYRYLLFKESRKELSDDIESLKKRIAGTD
uniref:Cyanobacterial aminoacyl-tRNA synthetase CAAD domain-containing protein n=1 Tax=Leersia perrieri TaxID=77586 RepID=A0A0D9VKM3_9ORYZ